MNPSTLRIVHVGCGGMAAAWLKSAASLPGLQVVGLADLNLAAAERRRDEFAPGAAVGEDPAALIQSLQPDIVFNCTVPAAHHPVSLAAFQAGAHVLSEKPLANSLDEARELVLAAEQANRLFAVTQNYRYRPAPRTVREVLESGALGPVTGLHCDFFIGAHFGGFRDEMEHVLLLDMAIHHFDLARFFGRSDPLRVFCQEWNPSGSWYHHGANAHAHFNLSNGAVFSYRGSWCAEGANTSWNGAWRIVGENGSLTWDGEQEIRVETVARTGGFRSEMESRSIEVAAAPGKDAGHESLIAEFAECVRSGRQPETSGADNICSLAMVFKAIESARENAVIKF
jgi:predicted dehydrogenase